MLITPQTYVEYFRETKDFIINNLIEVAGKIINS